MPTHKELNIIGENCTYYSSNSLISAAGMKSPTSCTTCSNWSGAKCLINVYDSIKNLVESEKSL